MTTPTRTNRFINPVLGGDVTSTWFYNPGGATATASVVSSGGVDPAVPLRRLHFDTDSISTSTFGQGAGSNSATYIAVTAGLAYSASLWVRHSLAVARNYTFYIQYWDASSASTGAVTNLTLVQPNIWTRLKYDNYVAPANSVRARILGYVSGAATANNGVVPAGSNLDMTMPIVEQASTVQDFFSGNTIRADGYDYAWTGTPHASTSIAIPLASSANPLALASSSAALPGSVGAAPLTVGSTSSAILVDLASGSAPISVASTSRALPKGGAATTKYDVELMVELGIGRQIETGRWDSGIWADDAWSETDTSLGDWVDVTCDVADPFHLAAGSSNAEGIVTRWEAATCKLTLYGDEYDPWNGPWRGILGPGVGVRVRWRYVGGSWAMAFTGRVAASGWTWTPAGAGEPVAKTEVSATDLTETLVAYDAAKQAAAGSDETASARVTRILNTADWPAADRRITSGGIHCRPTTLAGPAWEQLLIVADTDLALLWVDRAGRCAYIPAGRVGEGTVNVATIKPCPEDPANQYQLVTLGAAVFNQVNNLVSISHAKDEGASTDPPVTTVRDDASAARYGRRAYSRTDLAYADTEESWWPTVLANAVLTSSAWPSAAPRSITLDTRVDKKVAGLLLAFEPNHIVTVTDTGGRVWQQCILGWDIEVGTQYITGTVVSDDVGRWIGGKWDTAGWDRDRWGFIYTGA